MKRSIVPAVLALLAATAIPAIGQETSADPSLSLSTEVSGDASAPTEGRLDAQITSDNSYASLIAAIAASEAVDLSALTEESKISIVLVSTLSGDAATEGAALDAAITAQTEALTALRANATANAAINAKVAAEGYTADDIVAIRTDASGNTLVYIDDRS